MPRPARPEPTAEEVAERILVAIRAAGGAIRRTQLLESVRPKVNAAQLDAGTEILVGRRLITVATEVETRRHVYGYEQTYEVTVYRLTAKGRRA